MYLDYLLYCVAQVAVEFSRIAIPVQAFIIIS